MKQMFVRVDESGDESFGSSGTKTFLATAFTTCEPDRSALPMENLLRGLRAEGRRRGGNSRKPAAGAGELYEEFHATYDHPQVRRRVFECIDGSGPAGSTCTVALQKSALGRQFREEKRSIYCLAVSELIVEVLREASRLGVEGLVIHFDQALNRRVEKKFKGQVKPMLAESGLRYEMHFGQIRSDPNGQIADYVSWAYHRWFERGEREHLQQLSSFPRRLVEIDGGDGPEAPQLLLP